MTHMPEPAASLPSFSALAAVMVGFANFMDPTLHFTGVEHTIHDIEIYLCILIGAVTFSGSVIAFGKLSAHITGKPMLLPARHWLNLGLLIAVIWFGREFVLQSAAGGGLRRPALTKGRAGLPWGAAVRLVGEGPGLSPRPQQQ